MNSVTENILEAVAMSRIHGKEFLQQAGVKVFPELLADKAQTDATLHNKTPLTIDALEQPIARHFLSSTATLHKSLTWMFRCRRVPNSTRTVGAKAFSITDTSLLHPKDRKRNNL